MSIEGKTLVDLKILVFFCLILKNLPKELGTLHSISGQGKEKR